MTSTRCTIAPERSTNAWLRRIALLATATLALFATQAGAAQPKAVQTGTLILGVGLTSATVTLSPAVDITKSFLVFGASANANVPSCSQVSGQITNATTITFARAGTACDVTIKWYVAEFASGVSVQRGTYDWQSGYPVPANIPLAPVNTTKSFPVITYRAGGTTFDDNDFLRAKLTTGSNLQISASAGIASTPQIIEWQVIEYTDATVQSGDIAFAAADFSKQALAPGNFAAVTPSRSWLVYSYEVVVGGAVLDPGKEMVRGVITNGSTLTFDRNHNGGGAAINLTWYLIEFTDGTKVQHQSEPFSAIETQRDVTLAAVSTASSIAVAGGDFQRGGRTGYGSQVSGGDDNVGVAWFTLDITSSTNLRITRGVAGPGLPACSPVCPATADVGWFVMSFNAGCCSLSTTGVPGSTVTVTGAGQFEMRFNSATGGGVDKFYDLALDPVRAFDLAGSIGNASHDSLFLEELEQGGGASYWTNERVAPANQKLDLLEATATRVRVRAESFYGDFPGGNFLPGLKAVGDYSVYPSGRMALRWNRMAASNVPYTADWHTLTVHYKSPADPLSNWTTYSQTGAVPTNGLEGTGSQQFLLSRIEQPQVATDFLLIRAQDWPAADVAQNRQVAAPDEALSVTWRDSTPTTITGGTSQAWNYLTYFKPTNLGAGASPWLDPAAVSRSIDYRTPSAITVGSGSQWLDAAENTAAVGDFFNESEAAYLFNLDPVTGLTFDMDGSGTTRYSPFFKIRQWRSFSEAPTVTYDQDGAGPSPAVALVKDVDYKAAVKPVSRAHFADRLTWHCTLDDNSITNTCTSSGLDLDVGSDGDVSSLGCPGPGDCVDIVPARYGLGARFDANSDYVRAPGGVADFSVTTGAIEFWYQPNGNHTAGTRNIFWRTNSGDDCFVFEKSAANALQFTIRKGSVSNCTSGGTIYQVTVPSTNYSWRAKDWVHLKTTWSSAGAGPMQIFVNGSLAGSTTGYDSTTVTNGPIYFGGCNVTCPLGATGNADGVIDEPHIYANADTPQRIAAGGLLGAPGEYLADGASNFALSFVPVDGSRRGKYAYFGADSKFLGLNLDLALPGSATVADDDITWQYWRAASGGWVALLPTDGTKSFKQNGTVSWADPSGWTVSSVDGGPDLYYVRAHLKVTSVGYASTYPIERLIKPDILLFQYCSDVTAAAQFAFAPPNTADLAITKTDGVASSVPGSSVSYTITVTNLGPTPVSGATVTDTLPAALTGASWTCAASPGSSCSATGLGNILDTVNLLVGGTATYTLGASIDPFARGSVTNTAGVSPPAGVTDSNGTNDFASDTDALNAAVDVSVVKSHAPQPAPLGGILTYTLTVANAGPSGATGVTVTDPLPLDMAFEAVAQTQGSCGYVAATRTVDCTLGNIAPSASVTVTITVRPGAVGSVTNTATTSRVETDTDAANDSAADPTTVEVSSLGVRFFTATSTNQKNVLEWLNPVDADYVSTEIMVRGDRFPTGPGDGFSLYNAGAAGAKDRFEHLTGALSNGQTFYYGAFVHRAVVPLVSPGRFVSGRPFDTAGAVKWAFSTGATALAAPTVGGAGVIATSNDRGVYAMERGTGAGAGEWPALWRPVALGEPVQLRSPVIPVTLGSANPVVYLGAQDGKVYVVDAARGGSVGFPWGPTAIGSMVQAAPAGIFGPFGATLDYLLVGTRHSTAANAFVALDPYTGLEAARYTNAGFGEIGVVNGMAAVEYGPAPPRVYFTSYTRGSANTLWCFDLGAAPVFSLRWPRALGNIDSSPVLRGGRVYVGNSGTVYSIDALDGANAALDRTFVHGNGQVKGFVFPDRASSDLYFATNDSVWGVSDDGSPAMPVKFGGPISLPNAAKPSPVLFVPGSHYLYVGGSDGQLYEIDTALASPVPNHVKLGNGLAVVGAPSLDNQNGLVHVGSEAGIFYAVQVPLPPCIAGVTCTTSNAGQACYVGAPAECATKACSGAVADCQ